MKPREVQDQLRFEGDPEELGESRAYVCSAALDEVSRPPVCEHLFNDVATAPTPEHSLPILVAHILQEARGWSHPCLQPPPRMFFSDSSSLFIPTLPAPSLAPQKLPVLGELIFETNPISESRRYLPLCLPSCAPAGHYQSFFPT